MSMVNFLEKLSQQILVGIILVGGLGVRTTTQVLALLQLLWMSCAKPSDATLRLIITVVTNTTTN